MPPETLAERRLQGVLLLLTLATYAWFAQAGGWNHNSRFDVARALIERHTLSLDAYWVNTGDLATWRGHYYSDKAPLTGLLGAVPYALVWVARPLWPDGGQGDEAFLRVASWFVTLCISGLAAALTALFYRFARSTGAAPRPALGVALLYGLGSFAFPFATVLFGHVLAAALLFGSFALGSSATRPRHLALAGLLAALAAVAEYPTAGASALLLLWLAWQRRDRLREVLLPFAGGAALPVVLGMVYAWICFRDVFAVGYASVASGEISTIGGFGLSYPHPDVVWELLLGLRRGLFIGAPALLVSAAGLVIVLRSRPRPEWSVPAALVCLYYVLFVASYAWWDGGSSFGPRHLIPMLPFLCLGAIPAATRWPRVFLAAALVSALIMLAGAAHTPIDGGDQLLASVVEVASGRVADPGVPGISGLRESTNLGLILGLPGVLSLAPVLALWAFLGRKLWRLTA